MMIKDEIKAGDRVILDENQVYVRPEDRGIFYVKEVLPISFDDEGYHDKTYYGLVLIGGNPGEFWNPNVFKKITPRSERVGK